jgi:hypothetical protein
MPEGSAARHPDPGVLMICVLFHHGAGAARREAADAHRLVATGHTHGKVILLP